MSDDKATMPEYFNGFRDGYTRQTPLIDRQAAQIMMLREALATMLRIEESGMAVIGWREAIAKAQAALTATAEDQWAWEKQRRSEIIAECQQVIYTHPCVESESHANDLCAALEPLKW